MFHHRGRSLGGIRPPRRILDTIQGPPSPPHKIPGPVSNVPAGFGACSRSPRGDRHNDGERGSGNSFRPGFYSRLVLVEKSSGVWRPVIDLSPLNEFVHQTPFRMETPNSVLMAVRKNDFLASIDLKDAYFQIPVPPPPGISFVSSRMIRSTSSEPNVSGCRPPCKCLQEFSRRSRLGLTPKESACYDTWTTG